MTGVVIPFNISCGHCWMCTRGLYAQCETTQVREQGKGAALFGYTSLYGPVPGGQAQFLRVPQAQFGPVKIPGSSALIRGFPSMSSLKYLRSAIRAPVSWVP